MSVDVYMAQTGAKHKIRSLSKEIKVSEVLERVRTEFKISANIANAFLLDKKGMLYLPGGDVKGAHTSVSLELDGVTLFCFNLKDEAPPSPENQEFWNKCDSFTIFGEIVKKPYDFSQINPALFSPDQLQILQKYDQTLFSGFMKLATQYVAKQEAAKMQPEIAAQMASAVGKFRGSLRTDREKLQRRVDEIDSSFKKTVVAFEESLKEMESIELVSEVKQVMPDNHKLMDIYFDKRQMIQWRQNCVEMENNLLQAFKEYDREVQEVLTTNPLIIPGQDQQMEQQLKALKETHQKIANIHQALYMSYISSDVEDILIQCSKKEELPLLKEKLGSFDAKFGGGTDQLGARIQKIVGLNEAVLRGVDGLEKNASYLRKPKNFIDLYKKALVECSRRRQFDRLLLSRVDKMKAAINQEIHVRSEFKNLISQIFPKKCLLAVASTSVATLQFKSETPSDLAPIDYEIHREEHLPDQKELKPLKMLKELGAVNANATLHAVGSQLRQGHTPSGSSSARGASADELINTIKEQSDFIEGLRIQSLSLEKTVKIKEEVVKQLQKQVEEREEQIRNITRKIEEVHCALRNTRESCKSIDINAVKIDKFKEESEGLTPATKKIKEKLLADEIQESVVKAHHIIHQVCGKLYDLMAIKVGQRETIIAELREKIRIIGDDFEQRLESAKMNYERVSQKLKGEKEKEKERMQEMQELQKKVKQAEEKNKKLAQEEEKQRENSARMHEKEIPGYKKKVKILEDQLNVTQEKIKQKEREIEEMKNRQENKLLEMEQKLKKSKTDCSARDMALENKKIEVNNAKLTIKELETKLKKEERKVVQGEAKIEEKLKEARKKFGEEHKEMLSKIHASHKKDLEKQEKEAKERISELTKKFQKQVHDLREEGKSKSMNLLELNNQVTGILENNQSKVEELQLVLEERDGQIKELEERCEAEMNRAQILENQILKQENSPVKEKKEAEQERKMELLKEEIGTLEQERDAADIMRIELNSQLEQRNTKVEGLEKEVEWLKEETKKMREEMEKKVAQEKEKIEEIQKLKQSIGEKERSFEKQIKDSQETLRLLQKRRSLEEFKNTSEEKENQLSQSSDIAKRGSDEPLVHIMNVEQGQRMLFVAREEGKDKVSYVGIVLTEPSRKSVNKIQRLRLNEVFELDLLSLESNQREALKKNRMMVVGKVKRIEEIDTESDIRKLKCAVCIEHLVLLDKGPGLQQYSYQK